VRELLLFLELQESVHLFKRVEPIFLNHPESSSVLIGCAENTPVFAYICEVAVCVTEYVTGNRRIKK